MNIQQSFQQQVENVRRRRAGAKTVQPRTFAWGKEEKTISGAFQFGLRQPSWEKGQETISDAFQFGLRQPSWEKGQETISDAEVLLPLLPTVSNELVQQAAALNPTFLGYA